MRSILIIDHGSTRSEANHMLSCVANLVQQMVGDGVIVRHAHMEIAEPSIPNGFAECVQAGADEVIAFPYISFRVTDAFGVHEKLAELIALRAGIEVVAPLSAADACRCWDTNGRV